MIGALVWIGCLIALFAGTLWWAAREDARDWARMRALHERRPVGPNGRHGGSRLSAPAPPAAPPSAPTAPVSAGGPDTAADTGTTRRTS